MLNHIVLMGRLTRDPELKHIPTGAAVASFTLAVDRDFSSREEKQTDFIDIVAWRNTAEFVSKYFVKGQMAVVTGRLQVRDWTDRDGNKRRTAEVVAENVYFGESKKSRDGSGAPISGAGDSYGGAGGYPSGSGYGGFGKAASSLEGDFSEIDDDGELPF
jgi:single-strand DNA-binding protein